MHCVGLNVSCTVEVAIAPLLFCPLPSVNCRVLACTCQQQHQQYYRTVCEALSGQQQPNKLTQQQQQQQQHQQQLPLWRLQRFLQRQEWHRGFSSSSSSSSATAADEAAAPSTVAAGSSSKADVPDAAEMERLLQVGRAHLHKLFSL
jgi:hypothetical protein